MNVVDFFSGCGGASCGLRKAGCNILAGIDNNKDAAATFALNFPEAKVFHDDIRLLRVEILESLFANVFSPLLFTACAPCQPFSKQNRQRKPKDERIGLMDEFSRFVEHYLPDYIFIENVPGLQKFSMQDSPLQRFRSKLCELKYPEPHIGVVYAMEYGVPQWRPRLIIIASKHMRLTFPSPTHGTGTQNPPFPTVREWIGDLPPLEAGERDPNDNDHQAAVLSPQNLERIRHTPEGGGRKNWPKRLLLRCHEKMRAEKGREGHSDVYGRLAFDKPASGLTTRCISYSNGRFGHPTQDRAISLREAACLQTFPNDFHFLGPLNSKAKQVGNAVPPLLAEQFGKYFIALENER
jgi:DNA (cytosine-5)-methyltransferase 1